MKKDIVSDALNKIMNAKRAKKTELTINNHSKMLMKILDMAKEEGYLDYKIEKNEIKIKIDKLNMIKSIKPRYTVSVKKIDFYVRRFLPSKDFGFVVISTNSGLVNNKEAKDKRLGGCLIAYIY